MVFPMTFYGNKSWTLQKQDRKSIKAFELWCWRWEYHGQPREINQPGVFNSKQKLPDYYHILSTLCKDSNSLEKLESRKKEKNSTTAARWMDSVVMDVPLEDQVRTFLWRKSILSLGWFIISSQKYTVLIHLEVKIICNGCTIKRLEEFVENFQEYLWLVPGSFSYLYLLLDTTSCRMSTYSLRIQIKLQVHSISKNLTAW